MDVKIISNYQISPAILDMIKGAGKSLVLISPYIQLWGHLESEITSVRKRGVEVKLYFRSDKRKDLEEILQKLVAQGVEIFQVENLHSKIYASDSYAIVSSMNLYQYSAANSEEIAICSGDMSFVTEVKGYIQELSGKATRITGALKGKKVAGVVGGALKSVASSVASAVISAIENPGHCIRCNVKIEYNPEKPLCASCFTAWNKFKNKTFAEKFCHNCGKPNKTTIEKPVCYDCFKAGHLKQT